jgi:hypothetical protein
MWTFVTDATLAIFFNSPPRVAISEMIGDLPCCENLFRAETAPQYEQLILSEHSALPVSTLSGVMTDLVFRPVGESQIEVRKDITAANMLILICGMYCLLFILFKLKEHSIALHGHDFQDELSSVANNFRCHPPCVGSVEKPLGCCEPRNERWFFAAQGV